MANKIVSLLLQVKNAISPGVKEAANDMAALESRSRSLEKELSKLDNAKAAAAGLDDARAAAQKAEQAFDEAQLEVIKLKNALKSEKTPELALALEKANTAARSAKKEWQDSAKSVGQLEKAVKSAGGDLNDLATTQHELSGQIDRANGALRANKQHLDKARQGFEQTNKAVEKAGFSFSGFVAKAAALIGVVAVIDRVRAGFSALASNVWETGNQFELLDKRLNNFELGYIEEFARNVPQSLEGVADAFLKLRTFGIDPMNGSLQGLVDTTAAMGGSQVELEGIILAVGQAWSKQKLQQEEALQLIERGVPVWDLLAKAMGKTVPQLQAMSTAGELGRREIQLLMDAMAGANAGAAAKQMDSMQGLVSGLQDRFTSFYRQVADAGVWDYLKAQFQSVTAWFDQMTSSGQMEKLAKSISDGFIATAETVKTFVSGLYLLRGEFSLLAQAWLAVKIATWSQQLGTAMRGFTLLKGEVKGAATELRVMATAAKAAMGAFVISQIVNVVSAYRELRTEVAALEAVQRAQRQSSAELEARFRAISESTGLVVRSMVDLNAHIASGAIVIDELSGRYLSAAQAAELFAERAQVATQAAEAQALSVARLSGAYESTNNALQEAVTDHSKLAGVIQDQVLKALNGGIEGVGGFANALRLAQQQGSFTAKQINDELTVALDKLSEPEKQRFGVLLADAMRHVESGAESAGVRVEYLQGLLDALNTAKAESALKRLGISQAELSGTISAGMQQSVADLEILAAEIDGLSAVGKGAGDAVYTALSNAFRNVRTEADKQEFGSILNDFRNAGHLTYQQFEQLRGSLLGVGYAASDMAAEGASGMRALADSVAAIVDAAVVVDRDVRGVGESLTAFLQGTRGELAALSDEAAAFDNRLGVGLATAGMDELSVAVANARTELGKIKLDNLQVFDPTGINRFKNSVLEAKNETILAYAEQKNKFDEYVNALESGLPVSQSFINSARSAQQWMTHLGQQDLAQLRGALDDAQVKLQGLSDAAKSTLDQLQSELDRLQGNQDAINQRDYENKRKELTAAIEEARRFGNQEAVRQYTEALAVLEKVRQERNKQSAEQKSQQAANNATANKPVAGTSGASSGKTTTINLQSPSGNKAVQLTGDQNSVNQLLAVLEDAGLRSS